MNRIALIIATAVVCISAGIKVSALPQSEFYPPWWLNPGGNGSTVDGSLPQNFPQREGPPIGWLLREWISSRLGRNITNGNSSIYDHSRHLGGWWRSIFPWFNQSNGSIGNFSLPFPGGERPPMWWIWRNRLSSILDRANFEPGNFTNGNWSRFLPPWLRNGSIPFGTWQGDEGPRMWWNRRNWFPPIFGREFQHGNFTHGNWSRLLLPWLTFGNGSLALGVGGEGPPMLSIWRDLISSILSREEKQPDVNRRPYGGWWRYILPWNGHEEWNNGNHTIGNWTYGPPAFIKFWRRWLDEKGNNTARSTITP